MAGIKLKKGQITVFIIIGVIILFSFLMISYMVKDKQTIDQDVDSMVSLSNDAKAVEEYVYGCVREISDDLVEKEGISDKETMEEYFNDRIGYCIESLEPLKSTGIDVVEMGALIPDFNIGEDEKVLKIHVEYPLKVKKGNDERSLKDFYLNYALYNELAVPFDSKGFVKDESVLALPDSNIKLTISKGTKILLPDGSAERISIKATDKESYGDSQSVVGNVYDFGPDGAVFNPPLTMEIDYGGMDLSEEDEENLVFMVWDENLQEWVFLDPEISEESEVDRENNKMIVQISHFSSYAARILNRSNSTEDTSPCSENTNQTDNTSSSTKLSNISIGTPPPEETPTFTPKPNVFGKTNTTSNGTPGAAWAKDGVIFENTKIDNAVTCGASGNCNCNGEDYCGHYPIGTTVKFWPNGCEDEAMSLTCTKYGSDAATGGNNCNTQGEYTCADFNLVWKANGMCLTSIIVPAKYYECDATINGEEPFQKGKDEQGRPFYRFNKHPTAYPDNSKVNIICGNETYTINIPETSERCAGYGKSWKCPSDPNYCLGHDCKDESKDDSSSDGGGSLKYHHYNPKSWEGLGSALVFCPGDSFSRVSLNGEAMTKHGAMDDCDGTCAPREVWTFYSKPGVSGEIIAQKDGNSYSANVNGNDLQYGDC